MDTEQWRQDRDVDTASSWEQNVLGKRLEQGSAGAFTTNARVYGLVASGMEEKHLDFRCSVVNAVDKPAASKMHLTGVC